MEINSRPLHILWTLVGLFTFNNEVTNLACFHQKMVALEDNGFLQSVFVNVAEL